MFPPIEMASGPAGRNGNPARRSWAFTLVELLVAMAVLTLVMVVTVQLAGNATSITSASNKQFDASSMARIALDRLGNDFATAALGGGTTALYYTDSSGGLPNPTGNSSLGFVCKTRARKVASSVAAQDVRGIIAGYKIRSTDTILRAGSTVKIPLLNRGDAEFTFLVNGSVPNGGSSTDKYGYNLWDMFGVNGTTSLPKDLSTTDDTNLLSWQGLGDGVLRLHVSFVLNDGTIVQTPPKMSVVQGDYNAFQSNGGPGNCLPVAFSAANSADAAKRYVTGMIVGIVVLDQQSLDLGYARDTDYATTLAGQLKRPVNDGETPLAIWQANQNSIALAPVRKNIRFYQRFLSANP